MPRSTYILAAVLLVGCQSSEGRKASPNKLADGVYAVQRDSLNDGDLLPIKDGEVLAVHDHRYLKQGDSQPQRYLVVHSAPEVALALASAPTSVKEGDDGLRIFLKLQPEAASALERLTQAHLGKQIAIVINGEVVTMHKVREVIKGGDVQITSCAPGAAEYLLGQLQAHAERK